MSNSTNTPHTIIDKEGVFDFCKIVMLPAIRIDAYMVGKFIDSGKLCLQGGNFTLRGEPQHLYFVSNQEIRKGDWFICNQAAQQCVDIIEGSDYPYKIINKYNGEIQYQSKHWKGKVIAATDPSVIIQGDEYCKYYPTEKISYPLPQPTLKFIKRFVKEYNLVQNDAEMIVEYEMQFTKEGIPKFKIQNYHKLIIR